jgi:hypothetical protein
VEHPYGWHGVSEPVMHMASRAGPTPGNAFEPADPFMVLHLTPTKPIPRTPEEMRERAAEIERAARRNIEIRRPWVDPDETAERIRILDRQVAEEAERQAERERDWRAGMVERFEATGTRLRERAEQLDRAAAFLESPAAATDDARAVRAYDGMRAELASLIDDGAAYTDQIIGSRTMVGEDTWNVLHYNATGANGLRGRIEQVHGRINRLDDDMAKAERRAGRAERAIARHQTAAVEGSAVLRQATGQPARGTFANPEGPR